MSSSLVLFRVSSEVTLVSLDDFSLVPAEPDSLVLLEISSVVEGGAVDESTSMPLESVVAEAALIVAGEVGRVAERDVRLDLTSLLLLSSIVSLASEGLLLSCVRLERVLALAIYYQKKYNKLEGRNYAIISGIGALKGVELKRHLLAKF